MAVVGVVLHGHRPEAVTLVRDLTHGLEADGHTVRLPTFDAGLAHLDTNGVDESTFGDGLDVVVSLGGDGTILRTVELVALSGVPIIGVNLGQLGYLTEVEPAGLSDAMAAFFAGSYAIEERMLVSVRVRRVHADDDLDRVPVQLMALNEAVVEKTLSGHTVRLRVAIDGVEFTPYAADGLIVATPTGSTAYAFSARGPIIEPTHRALLLTPVSPHMLFDRSLILSPSSELVLTVDGRPAALIVDGHFLGELDAGDQVVCTAADTNALLVTFKPRNFHQILKAKFGLSDR